MSLFMFIALAAIVVRVLRDDRGPTEDFLWAWMTLLVLAFGFGLAALIGVGWAGPMFWVTAVLLAPWTVARRALIPLGLANAARRLSALSGWTWGRDRSGGGLVAAAWAIARQREPDRAAMDEVAAMRDLAPALRASHVLATGLMAAARGDRAGARQIIESVEAFGTATTPRRVHALAREWLAAEAAERGDWARVAAVARCETDPARPRTRMTHLLAAVARRFTGAPVSGLGLWARWLWAPRRLRALGVVRRAARVSGSRTRQQQRGASPRLGTSLVPDHHADALATHVAMLRGWRAQSPADSLRSLARVWDAALGDPRLREQVGRRAAILGAPSAAQALHDLEGAIARELAEQALAEGLPIASWSSESRTLREAERLLRDRLLGELELAFDALYARVASGRALSAMDEWREFLSLRDLLARATALGGVDLRRLAFPTAHRAMCKHAVWLWNTRDEYAMANAMFRFLLDEALAVGDAEAIELQSRNWDPGW